MTCQQERTSRRCGWTKRHADLQRSASHQTLLGSTHSSVLIDIDVRVPTSQSLKYLNVGSYALHCSKRVCSALLQERLLSVLQEGSSHGSILHLKGFSTPWKAWHVINSATRDAENSEQFNLCSLLSRNFYLQPLLKPTEAVSMSTNLPKSWTICNDKCAMK